MSRDKYLITGFSGFVCRHFCEYLESKKNNALIKGIDVQDHELNLDDFKHISFDFQKINLLSNNEIEQIMLEFKPNYILNLASYSSVAFSWKEPVVSFNNNTNIFLNILEAVRKFKLDTRILSIGSSEEYGNIKDEKLPLKEEHPLNPISPYAVARVSQELLSKVFVKGYGLDIVLTRSFNHIGPTQKDIFVVASFAKQLTKIKKSNCKEGNLITGDVSIIRDFSDVRDVVSAYYLLLHDGIKGEVYNVCSGKGISLREVISIMEGILNMKVTITVDEKFIRPDDNKIIIGCNEKIKKSLGWQLQYSLEQSLRDILNYWDSML
jgi:GDP-4-dehydro-6-deoxy-D-mannose reductase